MGVYDSSEEDYEDKIEVTSNEDWDLSETNIVEEFSPELNREHTI